MKRWQPSPFVRLSLALHGTAAATLVLQPGLWPWLLAGLLADHAVLTAAGLAPRSSLLGANWTRLPAPASRRGEVAITIDDGPDAEVTPRVLEILAAYEAQASFFCIGRRVAALPQLAREIVRGGHAIENHSYAHGAHFSLLGPRATRREIASAQAVIGDVAGESPRFFRAPAGLRNPFLDPVLAGLGLELASWTRRGFDTVAARPARVLARLERGLAPGDILLLHDGHAARTAGGTATVLEVLPALLEALRVAGLTPVTLRGARSAMSDPA